MESKILKGIPICCSGSMWTRFHFYPQTCAIEKATSASTKASAFVALGKAMRGTRAVTVTLPVEMTEKECYLAAIDFDPQNSSAYSHLGSCMTTWDALRLKDGTYVGKLGCHLMAIDLDPRNPVAYINLARFIESIALNNGTENGVEKVTLRNGTVMTKQDCYLAAIDCDPRNSCAYYILGCTVSADEKVTLRNGTVMTKQDCYLTAIDCDPYDSSAYDSLAFYTMRDDRGDQVALTVVSTSDCYRSSFHCGPDRSDSSATSHHPRDEFR